MARDGRSPNHVNKPVNEAPLVSLTIHTHYDGDKYYWEHFDIVRMSLETMLAGAGKNKIELIIWDNGSTPEFRRMLNEFKPDVMIESPNVGPHNARHALCHIARGKYINFADDDILYHPNWLDAMLEIHRVYPGVGVVSGSPCDAEFRRDFKPAHVFAAKPDVKKTTGHDLIPVEWERDWAYSIEKKPDGHKQVWQQTYMEYQSVKAWAMAHHMQMLCPRELITPFMRNTKNIVEFWDIAKEISAAGHLQLTTFERTAVHIGNRIDTSVMEIRKEWCIDG